MVLNINIITNTYSISNKFWYFFSENIKYLSILYNLAWFWYISCNSIHRKYYYFLLFLYIENIIIFINLFLSFSTYETHETNKQKNSTGLGVYTSMFS